MNSEILIKFITAKNKNNIYHPHSIVKLFREGVENYSGESVHVYIISSTWIRKTRKLTFNLFELAIIWQKFSLFEIVIIYNYFSTKILEESTEKE